ncbi:MAG: hypothetical protein ACM3Y9_09190 [Ignavibacteria bacterium]
MRPEATNPAGRLLDVTLASDFPSALRTTPIPSFDWEQRAADPVPAKLPSLFRVETICRLPIDESRQVSRAELFHAQAALSVFWIGGRSERPIARDALVAIRWMGDPVCCDGSLRIGRLVEVTEPESDVNLFEMVPYSWMPNRALLKEAAGHWRQASRKVRRAFTSRHWDAARFRAYLASYGATS